MDFLISENPWICVESILFSGRHQRRSKCPQANPWGKNLHTSDSSNRLRTERIWQDSTPAWKYSVGFPAVVEPSKMTCGLLLRFWVPENIELLSYCNAGTEKNAAEPESAFVPQIHHGLAQPTLPYHIKIWFAANTPKHKNHQYNVDVFSCVQVNTTWFLFTLFYYAKKRKFSLGNGLVPDPFHPSDPEQTASIWPHGD